MPSKLLKEFLDENDIKYISIMHSMAFTSTDIAKSAHIPSRELAKTVIVRVDGELAMAVIPANYKLNLQILKETLDTQNIELAQELADAMGGVVSCSRPIVDAKWLEKSRQVGTSGQTVKPKVYMAMGISGSFQHMGGVKGNPFIVAVNKNPKAPIFQVADLGIAEDILEFMPELSEKIQAVTG